MRLSRLPQVAARVGRCLIACCAALTIVRLGAFLALAALHGGPALAADPLSLDLATPAHAATLRPSHHGTHRHHRSIAAGGVAAARGGGDRTGKLAAVIYHMQPRKGARYAERVARLIVASAHREHVRPELVAATAVVESHFDMGSGPCIGIMQVYNKTYRERYRRSGLDPRTVGGNLRIGASELARHYDEARAHGRGSERARLAMMWGRYNGAGPRSGYVRRCLAAYARIRSSERHAVALG